MNKEKNYIKDTEALQASKFSFGGFMGTDNRTVEEIISADKNTLQHINVSNTEIAEKLKFIYEKTKNEFGAETYIDDTISSVYYESRGKIPSPFDGDGIFEKGEVVINKKNSNKSVIISALSIHLIEKYCFFQGKGSRYRIEPDEIINIISLG